MSEKKERFVTPKATAIFCMINTPSTKFKADGEYSIKLAMTPEEAQPLIEKLTPIWKAAVAKQTEALKPALKKTLTVVEPWAKELDQDTGEETGRLCFNFKMSAKVKSKKTGDIIELRPSIFDAKGNPIKPGSVIVGSGSKVRVSFTTRGYYMASGNKAGLTLDLQAVQIIDLVEWTGQASAGEYGFGEEDGFTTEEIVDEGDF